MLEREERSLLRQRLHEAQGARADPNHDTHSDA